MIANLFQKLLKPAAKVSNRNLTLELLQLAQIIWNMLYFIDLITPHKLPWLDQAGSVLIQAFDQLQPVSEDYG